MKHIAKLWENMLARRTLSMVLCLTLAVTSASVCAASTNQLVQETRAAGEGAGEPKSSVAEPSKGGENTDGNSVPPESAQMEGEPLTDDREDVEEEDTRCIHEFTSLWVGYECKLTDYVDGYEPGDEVRIEASFNKPVTSQIGLYIDGAWNSFRGEGKKRNITLVPDSDYLNIQISDLKGLPSVNLTDISVEIVRKGEADQGNYLHKFTGLWQGFETKFSDFNPDYEPGDEIRVTVNFSKYVSSQLGMNLNGQWSTLTGDGREISRVVTPDNDYLNIQITDMWANYKIGVISISVEIVKKGPGVQNSEDWNNWGSGRLEPTQYTEPGDYLLFSGDANEKYETNDGWILDCADTDWLTLTYSCVPEHENWGILGWGATIDGEWKDGPGYSADSVDSTKEVTQTFSVNYLRRMMKITPESNVSYLNLGAYSDGRIEELTLHVGSEIPRDMHLFQNGAVNQAWNCTDIERILNAPDDQYLCVQYTCATSTYENWTVLSWGASVDGEWRTGKSYRTSYHEATRNHFFSMRMDVFRRMLGLSWDAKVDSIQLSAYNDARILDIWFSDKPVDDPGDSKKEKVIREGKYSSPNKGTYDNVAKDEGEEYVQDTTLDAWQWKDIKNWKEIAKSLKKGVYIVIEYEAEDGIEPNLQFTMSDGKQQGVTPTYLADGQAVFSYKDIQDFLPDYLIPQEISNMQVSSGDGPMTVKKVKVVKNETDLAEEEIAVLTSSWSGFSTQISKWHSGYKKGDTVKVTVTFDKRIPGAIAFNTGGVWSCPAYSSAQTITRTAKPDDDYLGIQIGEIPKNKRYVKILDIKVEIQGKVNYNDYVQVTGDRSMGILADTKEDAATAVLTNEEIGRGVKVIFETERGSLTSEEEARVAALFGDQAESIKVAKVPDITVYKEEGEERTKIEETDEPVSFKVPVPDELLGKGYDFAVVREHKGELTFLEDLDGNESTVTFASSKFSRFAIVYGDKGAFDEQSGAIAVFRSAWNGFTTSFSKYNSKYKPGKPTKVTLTFDEAVKAYVDYNAPEWTREEGSETGKTFTVTITPSDDSLTIGIGDLNGSSKVKLLNVKVEQEQEKIKTFTKTNEVFITSFSEFNKSFVKGNETVVTLTFDKPVKSSIGYHNPNEASAAGNVSGTVHKITVKPSDDVLKIWLNDIGGNTSVNLLSVDVEQNNVEVIHTFTQAWGGGDNNTCNLKFSDYMSSGTRFAAGKNTTVKLIFSDKTDVKIQGGMEVDQTQQNSEVITFTGVPTEDAFGIQVTQVPSSGSVKLLGVEVTQEQTAIKTFTKVKEILTTTFSKYNESFVKGKPVTVKLTFDKDVVGSIGYHKADSTDETVVSGDSAGKVFETTFTPGDDELTIWIANMNGNTSVKLTDIEVIQAVDAIHTFTHSWGGDGDTFSGKISKYCKDFKVGDKVKITAVFDKSSQVKIMADSGGKDKEVTDTGVKVSLITVPGADEFSIQAGDDSKLPLGLLGVDVEIVEKAPSVESIFEFTGNWGSNNSTYESSFSEHMKTGESFQVNAETTVKLTFDKNVGVKIQSYNGDANETQEGADNIVQFVITPLDDKFSLQTTNISTGETAKLLKVEVTQKTEPVESIFEFTDNWGSNNNTYESSFSEHMKAGESFQANAETTVKLTFDKNVGVKIQSYNGDANETQEGADNIVQFVITPSDDKFSLQTTNISTGETAKLLKVEVTQKAEPVESIFEFTDNWGSNNSTYESSFSEHMKAGESFQANAETTVKLTFDKNVGVKIQSYNGDANETQEGADNIVQFVITPSDDKFSLQTTNISTGETAKLLKVEVTQKTEPVESIFEFTDNWGSNNNTYESSFSEHMKAGESFQANAETTVKLTFDKNVGVKIQSYNGDANETQEGADNIVQFVITPSDDKFSLQTTNISTGETAKLLKVEVTQASTASIMTLEDFILQEDPVYTFTSPETIRLSLADCWDEYELGQGVEVELNLFSDGNFRAMVEDADDIKATASNAKAAKIKATASNATPSNAGKTNDGIVFESDEDGMLTIKWQGKPKSGEIAVTILDMDGEQICIDSIDVTAKEAAASIKKAVASTAKDMAAANFPDKTSSEKEDETSLEQIPAKKEEDSTEITDEEEASDGKDKDSKKKSEGESAQKAGEESDTEPELPKEEVAVPEEPEKTENKSGELEETEPDSKPWEDEDVPAEMEEG